MWRNFAFISERRLYIAKITAAFMRHHTCLRFLSVASFLHLVPRIPHSDASDQCKSQVSIFRKALKGHTIDKFHVNRADVCIKTCQNEPRCQSINYVMEENICELNNRSKETRPEDYVTDPGRIYMTVPFNKGVSSQRVFRVQNYSLYQLTDILFTDYLENFVAEFFCFILDVRFLCFQKLMCLLSRQLCLCHLQTGRCEVLNKLNSRLALEIFVNTSFLV